MSDFLNYHFLGKRFEPNWPVMVIEGAHYIDLPLQKHAGSGPDEMKVFALNEYSRIKWSAASLETPTFTLTKGDPLSGATYQLDYTINVHGNYQSHRTAGMAGPMAILDILLFTRPDVVIEYMPRFALFEFACGENNVQRSRPLVDESDIGLREAHETWRHSFHSSFEETDFVRVSFQVQPAFYLHC